ncbi:CaiB/BaiF CoA transferase family protein [Halalkalibacter nanhaiisediminis]|uniref:Crotonobetainyl-CoA:carnitine CoA-transferase CaiB-like acyl-CoA transferase n=1 Tax=Halalkalibacter nanhaiisediminis TaxID=688079 RepID=A0A562QQS0_9BACI|nr:CoA transferase [Halalkalibacter nanhaiisediminis]TWI59074.1 crotonobetainyl-CoA:carnitine CoA-transferase CaiB-like acyl-CoA transferase [Halalkalibacter nanhaiisediminis]
MMLQGIKVFDFTQYLPGPFATLRLSDFGAEVIKIERPEGDPARTLADGNVFQANNRNKRSLSFDLKDEIDKEQLKDLLVSADVVVESFRPGIMDSLGLGFNELKKSNPELIYCSLTGYGQSGPLSKLGSHDINYMALSGLLSQMKDGNGKPVHPSLTFADLIGGMAASEAILAALFKREKTGEGGFIDFAIMDAVISLLTTHVQYPEGRGISGLDGSVISYHLYKTKDSRYISLGALESKFWANFCLAIDKEEWLAWHVEKAEEGNIAYEEMCNLFQSRTFAEWIVFSESVDCCLSPVYEINEVVTSIYNKNRGLIQRSPWNDLQVQATFKRTDMKHPPKLNEHQNDYSLNNSNIERT